jgi:squalene cyclase
LSARARGGSAQLNDAITRAIDALSHRQHPNGSWNATETLEPQATATQVVVDAFMGRLQEHDRSRATQFLSSQQQPDGGFAAYPGSPSSLSTSSLVWAALHAIGSEHAGPLLASTRRFAEQHGGAPAMVQRLFDNADQNALLMAMVGLVDPDELPEPTLWISILPPALALMERKLNAGVIMGALAMGWVTRRLRAQKRQQRVDVLWPLHQLEALRTAQFLGRFQNPGGDWDGNTLQTGLYAAGLFAAGVDVGKAAQWLDDQKIYDDNGMHIRVFTCENWMTAFALRAMLHAGVARTTDSIDRGLRFLCASQLTTAMPRIDQRQANAARKGGWAFQPSNITMPDSDDTAAVLSTMGLALQRDQGVPLHGTTTDLVQRAVDGGLPQLLDMQSTLGGWSAFVWGLGEKKPGPMYQRPVGMPRTLAQQAAWFFSPPPELQDPPTEGLTGRVLVGLAALGYRNQAPEVVRAMAWLHDQRADNGVWWGRWLVNYLSGTASVVSGLCACGVSPTLPWLSSAISWLVARQNDDGGWGETPLSYSDIHQAGVGPSMAPLTALVVTALLDAGMAHQPAVQRGIAYLLRTQQHDGLWSNDGWLQVMIPPDQFYVYEGERMCRPLEALARYRSAITPLPKPNLEERLLPLQQGLAMPALANQPSAWTPATIASLRHIADPIADATMSAIYRDGQSRALGQVMSTLVASDEPLPVGLPAAAQAYFVATEDMPRWADQHQLDIAAQIFVDHGWAVAMGLFTSSLPQSYCAAKGARVLLQTQGMTRNTNRRVLETAQFVFDVLNPGAFERGGRGIRAVQKVRLMHATIRHLILVKGAWDGVRWGVPINQMDLAGTLMTFSVVILDVIAKAGVRLSAEQQQAYVHLWNVVGHFMGVAPELTPTNTARGRELMDAVRDSQWASSLQGRELGLALVNSMDDYLPGPLEMRLPAALVRTFAGDRCADLLDLPAATWTRRLLAGVGVIDDLFGKPTDPRGDPMLRGLMTRMMERLINVQRDGKQTGFRIPQQLMRGWSLRD